MTPALRGVALAVLPVADVDNLSAARHGDRVLPQRILDRLRVGLKRFPHSRCGGLRVGAIRRQQKHLNQPRLAGECRQADPGGCEASKSILANLLPLIARTQRYARTLKDDRRTGARWRRISGIRVTGDNNHSERDRRDSENCWLHDMSLVRAS